MDDYAKIERVIRYLEVHHRENPSLQELASLVELSPTHFQKLFQRWAGITPKDFVSCLRGLEAGHHLRSGRPVLDAALESGLSGPGRLHDLCIKVESATPGEIRSGGEGMHIAAGFADTPFGPALFAEAPRGLTHLAFVDHGQAAAMEQLKKQWPRAVIVENSKAGETWSRRIFRSPPAEGPLRVFLNGTEFQLKVWHALMSIPLGTTETYAGLAGKIGHPRSFRAVGGAVGANNISVLVPCHRVLQSSGMLGGYRWGPTRKKALLARELLLHSRGGR